MLAEYIDRSKNLFADVIFPNIEDKSQEPMKKVTNHRLLWLWIETHCLICQLFFGYLKV